MKRHTLFDLIATLSRPEKRHLRLAATRLKKDSRYLRLFNWIESGRARDDAELLKRLAPGVKPGDLHVLKNYLAEFIIARLREFHAHGSPTAKLVALIGEIELLFERELFDLCRERIRKAAALAAKSESHALLCEVAAWKRALELSHPDEGLASAVAQESAAIADLECVNRYWKLTADMTSDPVRTVGKLEKSLGRPAKNEPYRARVLRHHLEYARHLVQGRTSRAEKELQALIALMESRPDRMEVDPGAYGAALSNLIALRLQSRRWDGIPGLFAKVPRLAADNKAVRKSTRRMRLRLYNLELEYLRDRHRPQEARALMEEIAAWLEAPGPPFPDDYRILFHFQFACINFQDGDFAQALRWINVMLADDYGGERPELQAHARLLSLAAHYELDNLILLRYAVDGYRRYLKKVKLLNPPAVLLLRFFGRLSTALPGQHGQIFSETREALKEPSLAKSLHDWSDFFDWPAWLAAQ